MVSEAKGVPVFVRDLGKVKIGAAQPTGIFGIWKSAAASRASC